MVPIATRLIEKLKAGSLSRPEVSVSCWPLPSPNATKVTHDSGHGTAAPRVHSGAKCADSLAHRCREELRSESLGLAEYAPGHVCDAIRGDVGFLSLSNLDGSLFIYVRQGCLHPRPAAPKETSGLNRKPINRGQQERPNGG